MQTVRLATFETWKKVMKSGLISIHFSATYESNSGDKLSVVRETNNQHDRCAVSILTDVHTVSHVLCENMKVIEC